MDLQARLFAYTTLANATGALMQMRINVLIAKNHFEIPLGFVVTVREGFKLYAIPAFQNVTVIPIDEESAEDLHSLFEGLKDQSGNDDDFEKMAAEQGIDLLSKTVGHD